MATIAEIKQAIARLSPREYCELMAELVPSTDDDWDRQMKADAAAGKFDRLNDEVRSAEQHAATVPLERILGDEP